MGLLDKVGEKVGDIREARAEAKAGQHYEAERNRGTLHAILFTKTLNERWEQGWRLAHMHSHEGDTFIVWERRDT